MPPCLGHDFFEGIVNYDLSLYLSYLVKKKWFTYGQLNKRITQFQYMGSDRNNKPCEVNTSSGRVGGQAVQNWCLIRVLPIILHDLIKDKDDDVWQLFLQLKSIVEYVCAPKITEDDVAVLDSLIESYLDNLNCAFPDFNLKPKHHFIRHYAYLITQFGPLILLWTMRFESKHSYFKRCIRYSTNFINVSYTLTVRHQLLQAYKCAGLFFPSIFKAEHTIPLHIETYNKALQHILKSQNFACDSHVTYSIDFMGTLYTKGEYIIIGRENICLSFGEIIFMVITPDSRLFFIIRTYQSEYNFKLDLHTLKEACVKKLQCVEKKTLLDYFPLPAYGPKNGRLISLKHAIPTSVVL